MARLAEHGVTEKLKFLIGVAPLSSAKSARWMKENLFLGVASLSRTLSSSTWMEKGRDPEEGRPEDRDRMQLLELAEIPGVSGAHLMGAPERSRHPRRGRRRARPVALTPVKIAPLPAAVRARILEGRLPDDVDRSLGMAPAEEAVPAVDGAGRSLWLDIFGPPGVRRPDRCGQGPRMDHHRTGGRRHLPAGAGSPSAAFHSPTAPA